MKILSATLGILGVALAGCSSGAGSGAATGGTLERVQQRGYLSCGASQGVAGLSRPDEKGVWRGFDVDVCRAFAAAALGSAEKVRFIPLNAAQRLPAVQTGEIDVLSRTTTITFTRDMAMRFVAPTMYDADTIIVRKALGIADVSGLAGRTVCLQGGGSLVENALDELESGAGIKVTRVYFDSTITARDTYFAGRCDAYITDGLAARSQLATVAKVPDEHMLLNLSSAVEPNGVAIARGDDRWFDLIRWTINVLVWAEQHGITQANVDEQTKSGSEQVRRVLGADGSIGRALGLDPRWAYNVIKQVGNYGEIWDRNLGQGTPIKAERRLNQPFTAGGLLFAYPWD